MSRFVRELLRKGRIESLEGAHLIRGRIKEMALHGGEIEKFMYPRRHGGRGSLEFLPRQEFTRPEVDILCLLLHRLLSEKGPDHGEGSSGKTARLPARRNRPHEG